jgi:ABC-type transport system involved in multi-copper enzyme maturation permease subunit
VNTIAGEIGLYLWRLLPGNPILVRVVCGGSRRVRHLWIRSGYLGVLLFVLLVSQLGVNYSASGSLAALAKSASMTFTYVSYVQLALMCFLAPVFTAGAITQEKDAQTFNILLTTPLTNAQIVFGSLMSRLFFVLVLLLAGLPIFCVTMLYGGVTVQAIFLSFGIAGCTAVVTGSLAIAVSMWKVGTRRTIFSFYMAIAVYLMLVFALGMWRGTSIPEAPATNAQPFGMSRLTPFHPFLALMAATNTMNVPTAADLGNYNPFWRWALSKPYSAYMVGTLVLSLVLVSVSTLAVRRGAREGESTRLGRLLERLRLTRGGSGERRRRPRNVWKNPVAWREAVTRASAGSQSLMRYGFVIGGLVAAIVLWISYVSSTGGLTAAQARDWLTGIVLIEFVTMLLLATNTAATAITREREANTMELLLASPLTSQYILFGKLRGLVSFTVPLIIVPCVSVAIFVVYDLLAGTKRPVVYPEVALLLPALMLAYSAFACMLGLHTSLKSRRTVQAVVTSVGILVVLGFGVGMCGWLFTSQAADTVGPIVAPFTMVVAVATTINPELTMGVGVSPATVAAARPLIFVGAIAAILTYALIVHRMYKNLVQNFDMTVRKQSQ